jgi:hypothetical protein
VPAATDGPRPNADDPGAEDPKAPPKSPGGAPDGGAQDDAIATEGATSAAQAARAAERTNADATPPAAFLTDVPGDEFLDVIFASPRRPR